MVAMKLLGFRDPLALSSGAGARLILAGGVLALLWLAVSWAMRG
jgi:hypothetical protein